MAVKIASKVHILHVVIKATFDQKKCIYFARSAGTYTVQLYKVLFPSTQCSPHNKEVASVVGSGSESVVRQYTYPRL